MCRCIPRRHSLTLIYRVSFNSHRVLCFLHRLASHKGQATPRCGASVVEPPPWLIRRLLVIERILFRANEKHIQTSGSRCRRILSLYRINCRKLCDLYKSYCVKFFFSREPLAFSHILSQFAYEENLENLKMQKYVNFVYEKFIKYWKL